jgi:hypothetical protein
MGRKLVAPLFLVVVLFMFLVNPTAGAQSSSACFSTPSDTALGWTSNFPSGNTDRQCMQVCNAWKQTCANQANAAYRCFQALFSSLAKLQLAECNTQPPDQRTQCAQMSNEALRSNNDDNLSSLKDALGTCGSNYPNCLDNCID